MDLKKYPFVPFIWLWLSHSPGGNGPKGSFQLSEREGKSDIANQWVTVFVQLFT